MKKLLCVLLAVPLTILSASFAAAHAGHGIPGTVSHDLQHQVWISAALIVVTALVLSADRIIATRIKQRKPTDRDS